jgi:hypothetical protein
MTDRTQTRLREVVMKLRAMADDTSNPSHMRDNYRAKAEQLESQLEKMEEEDGYEDDNHSPSDFDDEPDYQALVAEGLAIVKRSNMTDVAAWRAGA